jgi:hypothetical protein
MALLAVYFFIPLFAVWFARRSHARPAAIVLLGVMASGVVINALLFEGLVPPPFAPPVWLILFRAWVLCLIGIQVVISWIAFMMLRDIHRQIEPHAHAPHQAESSNSNSGTP